MYIEEQSKPLNRDDLGTLGRFMRRAAQTDEFHEKRNALIKKIDDRFEKERKRDLRASIDIRNRNRLIN